MMCAPAVFGTLTVALPDDPIVTAVVVIGPPSTWVCNSNAGDCPDAGADTLAVHDTADDGKEVAHESNVYGVGQDTDGTGEVALCTLNAV